MEWLNDDDAKYQADYMEAEGLTYPPVSPMVKAIAESLRASKPVKVEPVLNEMDKAVLRARGEAV